MNGYGEGQQGKVLKFNIAFIIACLSFSLSLCLGLSISLSLSVPLSVSLSLSLSLFALPPPTHTLSYLSEGLFHLIVLPLLLLLLFPLLLRLHRRPLLLYLEEKQTQEKD